MGSGDGVGVGGERVCGGPGVVLVGLLPGVILAGLGQVFFRHLLLLLLLLLWPGVNLGGAAVASGPFGETGQKLFRRGCCSRALLWRVLIRGYCGGTDQALFWRVF